MKTHAVNLGAAISSAQTNADFSEAVLTLKDGSLLCFCHRVGERYVKAFPPADADPASGQAHGFMQLIEMFRLNAKHLDVQFHDASRWDRRLSHDGTISDAGE